MSFYITTPIYYVNAAPHLGHAYTEIAADILARHHRARGEETFFLTGTDEHGEPVTVAAAAEGVSPQELVDRNAERFRALTGMLELSNDFFIRTTDPEHKRLVQEFLQRVHDNGYVYKGFYEGWYCPQCADFKTATEIAEGNRCPIHLIELTREREETWFFRLSAFQEPLERLYAERPDFVMPAHAFNETRSFVAQGLVDVSLSRAALSWGVTVPWEPSHVFYVWFDALLNYVTALGYARPGESLLRLWPAQLHMIGKDISKFHAVYWPALLMAGGLEPPRQLFVHGFLLGPDDAKMSKSRGNVLDPFAIIESHGADALRHYLFREVTFGQDGPVSQEGFQARYDAELANEYGNLASRTLNMLERYSDGIVPAVETEAPLRAEFAGLFERLDNLLSRAELSAALEQIWQHVRRLNRYVEENAPWALAKDAARAAELAVVLASLAEGLRVVTVALLPYMPSKTAQLLDALDCRERTTRAFAAQGWGARVSALAPLFPKGSSAPA
jgi:methionyl-tRNA synthetase